MGRSAQRNFTDSKDKVGREDGGKSCNPLYILELCQNKSLKLKGNKGQNQYFTRVFIGKIQVTFRKGILYPDTVNFEILPLKVGIRSLGWDHGGRNPDKRS